MNSAVAALSCFLAVAGVDAQTNVRCEWPRDVTASWELRDQVRLAEDLAVRFADALGETPQYRANRERCEAALFASLAQADGVSVATVLEARRSLADRPFDWLVNVPMAGLVLGVGFLLSRWAAQRFGTDEALVSWIAVTVGAVALAVAVVVLGQVWAAGVEALRIGNGHLSYRASRIPWQHHRVLTLVLATASVLFIHAATRQTRRAA